MELIPPGSEHRIATTSFPVFRFEVLKFRHAHCQKPCGSLKYVHLPEGHPSHTVVYSLKDYLTALGCRYCHTHYFYIAKATRFLLNSSGPHVGNFLNFTLTCPNRKLEARSPPRIIPFDPEILSYPSDSAAPYFQDRSDRDSKKLNSSTKPSSYTIPQVTLSTASEPSQQQNQTGIFASPDNAGSSHALVSAAFLVSPHPQNLLVLHGIENEARTHPNKSPSKAKQLSSREKPLHDRRKPMLHFHTRLAVMQSNKNPSFQSHRRFEIQSIQQPRRSAPKSSHRSQYHLRRTRCKNLVHKMCSLVVSK